MLALRSSRRRRWADTPPALPCCRLPSAVGSIVVCVCAVGLLKVMDAQVMVTGRNATGKTSFVRVVAGLWPIVGGELTVPCPVRATCISIWYLNMDPNNMVMKPTTK